MSPHEFYAPIKDFDSASRLNTSIYHAGLGTTLREYYGPVRQSQIATGFHGLPFNTGIDPQNHQNLHGHTSPAVAVGFSPDGNFVAAGSKAGELRIWSIARTNPRRDLFGHSGMIAAVVFSPDGALLASASADQTIRLWNPKNGQTFQVLTGHTSGVTAVTFSRGGRYVVSGSEDKTVRIWDITTGSCRTVSGQKPPLEAVGFSLNGELAALSSCGGSPSLKLFDLIDPQYRFLSNLGAVAHALAFSPDGKTLAAGLGDNTVQYWDIAKDESCILIGHEAPVFAIACSTDDTMIASGSADGSVRIWNKAEVQNHLIIATEAKVWAVSFSPDGTSLAVGLGSGTVRVFGIVAREKAESSNKFKGAIRNFFKGRDRSP